MKEDIRGYIDIECQQRVVKSVIGVVSDWIVDGIRTDLPAKEAPLCSTSPLISSVWVNSHITFSPDSRWSYYSNMKSHCSVHKFYERHDGTLLVSRGLALFDCFICGVSSNIHFVPVFATIVFHGQVNVYVLIGLYWLTS